MKKHISLSLLFFLLIILSLIFLSIDAIQAQESGGNDSDQPYPPPTSTLKLIGMDWVEATPATVTANDVIMAQAVVDCNILSSPIVGYEVSKGQNLNDVADFVNDLTSSGYSVGTVDITAGPIPPCVDILIVLGLVDNNSLLSANYTPAEGATIQAWVAAGHSLMLSGDWGQFRAGTEALFQAFGYSQQGTLPVRDTTDFEASPLPPFNSWVIYQTDNFANHPSLVGVNSVELIAGSWFSPTTDAIVTADADAIPPAVPVVVAFNDAAGCVAFFGDSNWVTTDVNTSGYPKEDNARLARQMIDWLTSCVEVILSKSAPPVIQAGQLLTYTMQANNKGTVAVTSLLITDTLPLNTNFVTASPPHTGPDAAGVITWPLATLDVGASATVTMVVQVDSAVLTGTLITNTAMITNVQGLTATAKTTTRVSNPIINPIITKRVNPQQVQPGNPVTFTLAVRQVGATNNATNVQVLDLLSNDLELLDVQMTTGSTTTVGQNLSWTIPLLSPTQIETVTIRTKVADNVTSLPTTIINQASLGFDQGSERLSNVVEIAVNAPPSTSTATPSPTSMASPTPTSPPPSMSTPTPTSPPSTGGNDDDDDDAGREFVPPPAQASPVATKASLPIAHLPETGGRTAPVIRPQWIIPALVALLLMGLALVVVSAKKR